MARNRYGWQKRAKELARKQKNDDKMKRRQGKTLMPEVQGIPGVEEGLGTNPSGQEGLASTDTYLPD